jgi:UDP-N-acetylglucosamine--N-acetylmuramyl-(pentapeptide) pyrophosphoryl-undecaprenol N-acetylglucosamine transferase
MMAAAIATRTPTALLEQNVHVGVTNRVLARMVGRAYLTYPETAHLFGDKRARVFGNPMRRAFVEAARAARHDPAGMEARARNLLVLGGSQGAKALNETVPEALAQLGESLGGVRIVHQTGSAMLDEVRARYEALGIEANVTPFIDDMARAYGHAALVVARAGATTLAELCAIGRPAVLIPFPHAAEDHQTRNAEALESAGAAVVAHERELDPARLAAQIGALLADGARRREMAEAARSLGRPEAAAAIVDDLSDWLGAPIGGQGQPDPDDDAPSSGPGASERQAAAAPRVQRRPRVRRAALRLHTIEPPRDAVG